MKYKVGEKVVSNNGVRYKITDIHLDSDSYYVEGINGTVGGELSEDNIDHDKTAELNSDETLKHYSDELTRIVAKKEKEAVNHPSHYNEGEFEAIDVIKDITRDYPGYEGYLVGNMVKYLYRANHKADKVEDLKKAQFHMDELIRVMQEEIKIDMKEIIK